MKQQNKLRNNKIISLQLNASFFYRKAIEALDRYNYEKGLKYFQRAVEYEPDNPVNHCNLAGVLSELGKYEESNQILQKVLTDVASDFYECYFFMANNCANMEDYESAEEYAIDYLEHDPDGLYAEDAYELLDYLSEELKRPVRNVQPGSRSPQLKSLNEASQLLENGQFFEAARMLEETIVAQPDFLAARNNLSLCYYFMGRFQEALDEVKEILEIDPNNLHALCNLAIYNNHNGDAEEANLVASLAKIFPFHTEQIFKLATTLGILGEHRMALHHFMTLYNHHGIMSAQLIHQIAVAHYNLKNWEGARRWWRKLNSTPHEIKVRDTYLNLLDVIKENVKPLGYQYPDEETSNILNPFVRSSIFWALFHGDEETKLKTIHAIDRIGDDEAREILLQFVLIPEESDDLKREALLVLKKMDAPLPIDVVLNGERMTIDRYPSETSPNRN